MGASAGLTKLISRSEGRISYLGFRVLGLVFWV